MTQQELKAPFPWFGGKSRVADIVWSRFGDVANYVEPFAGSLAVLLARPTPPRVETVNDKDCVGPETRILRADLTWARADEVRVGDRLVGFDEHNGEAREGLRAPKRYRRLAHATVTAVRALRKPCYRLTFDDGTTVVASSNHLWLGGSHASGGRGWRWVKTESMVCNRATQRSWVLKVVDVVEREETWEAGWLGGFIDGEGSLKVGPGLRVSVAQKEGKALDRAQSLLEERGYSVGRTKATNCWSLQINGGGATALSLLMRFRPERLISKLPGRLSSLSLYGRQHRAVGLVSKEFLGEQEVIAIETDCSTFVAEGLASHNCYLSNFWRALQADPDAVAHHADWPVNEADLHARHLWLVQQEGFRERMMSDPEYYDAKIAGWWVWGLCQWIGSGWCDTDRYERSKTGKTVQQIPNVGTTGRGMDAASLNSPSRRLPHLSDSGTGVHRPSHRLPSLGDLGRGGHRAQIHTPQQIPLLSSGGMDTHSPAKQEGLYEYFHALADRLRRVRVCCGEWDRILGPSVTEKLGVTGIFLDPPYEGFEGLYAAESGVSGAVREWAIANGSNKMLRIALCGYEGEHSMPGDWECVPWKAQGGYGSQGIGQGRENAGRERIWFSPACLKVGTMDLFSQAA